MIACLLFVNSRKIFSARSRIKPLIRNLTMNKFSLTNAKPENFHIYLALKGLILDNKIH